MKGGGGYKPNIRTIRNNTGSNIYNRVPNKMLPTSIKNICKQGNCSETRQQNQNPLYRSVHGLPLGARKPNTKMAEIILLTSWQTTQGPDYLDRSRDGEQGPDNFRNNKNETKF
jgi:hypothetical protein